MSSTATRGTERTYRSRTFEGSNQTYGRNRQYFSGSRGCGRGQFRDEMHSRRNNDGSPSRFYENRLRRDENNSREWNRDNRDWRMTSFANNRRNFSRGRSSYQNYRNGNYFYNSNRGRGGGNWRGGRTFYRRRRSPTTPSESYSDTDSNSEDDSTFSTSTHTPVKEDNLDNIKKEPITPAESKDTPIGDSGDGVAADPNLESCSRPGTAGTTVTVGRNFEVVCGPPPSATVKKESSFKFGGWRCPGGSSKKIFTCNNVDTDNSPTTATVFKIEPGTGDAADSMIVEDAERLRSWLTAILQPLCDADPAALAKYVLALIKKDKPEKELRQSMSDQLEVFLQTETPKFVDRLFELLRSKEYMTKPPPPIIPKNKGAAKMPLYDPVSSSSSGSGGDSNSGVGSSVGSIREGDVLPNDSASNVGGTDGTGTDSMTNKEGDITMSDVRSNVSAASSIVKKERKDDMNDRDRSRRRRSRSPFRRRVRSRSPPGRGRDKKYHPRKNWRSGRRSRSRSPYRASSAGRNRSRSPVRYRRHPTRSRSRSPKLPRTPPPNSSSQEPGLKDGDKPSLQSVVVKAGTALEKIEKGNRCRDFDEKGLCMRGELCPFDHGTDPVVLEDVVIPGVTTASGQYNQALAPADAFGASNMMRPGLPPPVMGEYYPDNPGMEPGWGMQFRPRMGFDPMMRGRPMMGPRPMGPFPPPAHRDLISVPVMGMPIDHMGHPMAMHPRGMHMGRGRGRGGFDHSRLGFPKPRHQPSCSLEVKKIPRELNNIMDLNSHFAKFGKIVNIAIGYEGDPEAALVTFSLPQEAQLAHRSTEAVLNNRFIRVFWHSKEKENEETSDEPMRLSVRDRLGGIEGEENESQEKILVSGNNITKTVYNPNLLAKKTDTAAEKLQAVEAIKKSQELLAAQEALKKVQEERRKEALRLINDLTTRKQGILDEQLKYQKTLISKIEKNRSTMTKEETGECMKLIKQIQEQIENLKKELVSLAEQARKSVASAPKSKEEAQREMLDAELELYNKEQEGDTQDMEALQRKIYELRARSRSMGGTYRGRGGYRGARGFSGRGRGGRGAMRALRTVDRRPTRVRITGFPVARLPEILPHFSQFGTIVEYETDTVTPSMVLNFDSRKSAEIALNNGKIFGESELEITWVVNGNPEGAADQQQSSNGQRPEVNGASAEDDEDLLANEILLTYEEDEEEDNTGDRSWRR